MKKGKTWVRHILLTMLSCILWLAVGSLASAESTVMLSISGKMDYSAAKEVLDLVNKERAAAGVGQLVMDQTLQHDAMMRAIEISLYFSHTRPNGETCFTAFTNSAVSKAENISTGDSASEVMSGWMNSDGHRTNILNGKYKEIGIGCFYHNGRCYWVQCFTNNSHANYVKTGEEWVTGRIEALPSKMSPSMAYTGSTSLTEGDTLQLYVVSGRTILVPSAFTWSVSDSSLATVSSSGVLTANGAGTVAVKAQLGTIQVSQTVTISHKWSTSYRTITAATCTGEGTKGIFCTHCGKEDTSRRTSIPKLGHSYGSWKTTKAATCTADGVSTRTCTRCGAKQTKAITKLGHSYGSWKTTKAATCLAWPPESRRGRVPAAKPCRQGHWQS